MMTKEEWRELNAMLNEIDEKFAIEYKEKKDWWNIWQR
jgi:hypothetical protein